MILGVLDVKSVSPISKLKRLYNNVCYAFLVSVTVSLHNFSFIVLTVYLSSPVNSTSKCKFT